MDFDSTRVKIDLDAIASNMDAIREKAGVPVMAVVKADAYGHGAVQVARLLQDKCAFFCVSSILEAMELRQAGLSTPILILGHTPADAFPTAIREGIRPTIYRLEDALALSKAAQFLELPARFHFAVDTGMSRIGFQVTEEDADICARIASLPGLFAEGLFSHFATADCADLTRAKKQAERFAEFDGMLRRRGVKVPIRHLNNSAGLMNFATPYEMVRSGIITYGMYPSDEVDPSLLSLRPALQWLSRVTHVKTLPAGREISYGGTYVTKADTVVATIPVGYADGYRRNLSGKFYVLIHGQKAPILGRICMDQMMVDVTHIPGVQVGDRVTLVGADGDETITMEQISAQADSFNYEFVCGISRRVPRLYVQGGKTIHTVHYLLDAFL
ncbi:MAG: alanine racemase [Candidatus Faecousia sp.]|nr:alanine racemase [Clostridiales bacterium]MDD5883514.1 alanine racemase [Bacillota bacterium]MDY4599362.1 alanine racemase [Candidatus Faecousia sp.]